MEKSPIKKEVDPFELAHERGEFGIASSIAEAKNLEKDLKKIKNEDWVGPEGQTIEDLKKSNQERPKI